MSAPSLKKRDDAFRSLLLACRMWLLTEREKQRESPSNSIELLNRPSRFPFPNADLDVLGPMAFHHGLEPLLHQLILKKRLSSDGIPDQIIDKWERAYFGVYFGNSEMLNLLSRIVSQCRKAGVSFTVLKGPTSVAFLYKDLGLRPMADIDIMCRKADFRAVRDVSLSQGFHWDKRDLHVYHLRMRHPKELCLLEIHFGLYPCVKSKKKFLNKSLADSKDVAIDDFRLPMMPIEHQIIFELAHIVHNDFTVPFRQHLDFIGKLFVLEDRIDMKSLMAWLDKTKLVNEFIRLSSALAELLQIPLSIVNELGSSDIKSERFGARLRDHALSYGFVQSPHTGAGFERQQGLFMKLSFLWQRLFPGPQILQAIYDLKYSLTAFLYSPRHAWLTLRDYRKRKTEE